MAKAMARGRGKVPPIGKDKVGGQGGKVREQPIPQSEAGGRARGGAPPAQHGGEGKPTNANGPAPARRNAQPTGNHKE
eukprot:gene3719-4131_t